MTQNIIGAFERRCLGRICISLAVLMLHAGGALADGASQTGDYGFKLAVIDAKLSPDTADDLFRIKIWDRNDSDVVVYDTDKGLDDNEDPSATAGGRQIRIHTR